MSEKELIKFYKEQIDWYIVKSKDGKTMIFTDGHFFGYDFRADGVDYTRDEHNGRYYKFDISISLKGGYVRRRISKEEYRKALRKAVKELGFNLSTN